MGRERTFEPSVGDHCSRGRRGRASGRGRGAAVIVLTGGDEGGERRGVGVGPCEPIREIEPTVRSSS